MNSLTNRINEQSIRARFENQEHEMLSPYASFSDCSKGRDRKEAQCDIRTVYQRDRDRILYSKAFRRLKGKTQVFLAPKGDHYRTRLAHTLEVSQTARTIARALKLNEDLAEAIALGHDLGHTPFGHAGERALNSVFTEEGFEHHLQSVRVVEVLEKHGEGLNLTWEVRDGIKNHQTKGSPATLEGKIVRLSDKIAYINSDIDDAIRGHIITEADIPIEYREILGCTPRERLNTIIHDIVLVSEGKNDINMSPDVEFAMTNLRKFMFENVYTNPKAKSQEKKAISLVVMLYEYYLENVEEMPDEFTEMIAFGRSSKQRAVCDYIAGMTDQYAVTKLKELLIPSSWSVY